MNAEELTHLLTSNPITRTYFGGVVPQDQLQHLKIDSKKTSFYVVNTDYTGQPGEHWTVIFLQKDSIPEFFDSLANRPQAYGENFTNFLIQQGPNFLISRKRIQAKNSSACGHFCVYYAFFRCLMYSMEQILDMFSWTKYLRNDIKARNFVNMLS